MENLKRFSIINASVLATLVMLTSCATTDPKEQIISESCKFTRDRPSTLVSYVNNRNGIVYGDIVNKADLSPTAIYVAIAGTKSSSVRTRSRQDACFRCVPTIFGPQCGYVSCSTYSEEDVRHVYGLARATSKDSAETMALDNCNQMGKQFARENDIPSFRMTCEIIRTNTCF